MAGCYGNHPEDLHYERMLDKYLDDTYGDKKEEIDYDDYEEEEIDYDDD